MRLHSPQNTTPAPASPSISPRDDSGDIFMATWGSDTAKDQDEYPSHDDSCEESVVVSEGEGAKRNFSFLSNTSSASSSDTEDTKTKSMMISNRLDDIMQCSNSGDSNKMIVVTSASYPFHVEWVNSAWSEKCGWSSDEVLGLDCKFLQGDATDMKKIRVFMRDMMISGGRASLDILNYNKDNTLSHNIAYCMPIVDDCGHDNAQEVSHIALVLQMSSEVHHSSDCAALLEGKALEEVGMPLDRREACNVYPHRQVLPPPGINDWLRLTDGLPLALMLRYMLRTQAPIVLIDRDGKIVHVNVGWVALTGYSGVDSEGRFMSSLLDNVKDPAGTEHFVQLMQWLKAQSMTKMHVNVHLTKKPRMSTSPGSRKGSIRSSFSAGYLPTGHFGMHASDSISFLNQDQDPIGSNSLPTNPASKKNETMRISPPRRSSTSTISPSNYGSISPPQFGFPVVRADSNASLFSSPRMSRRGSWREEELESFPCQLSPVPIGLRHFAVLCIPTAEAEPRGGLMGNKGGSSTCVFGVADVQGEGRERMELSAGSSASGSSSGSSTNNTSNKEETSSTMGVSIEKGGIFDQPIPYYPAPDIQASSQLAPTA